MGDDTPIAKGHRQKLNLFHYLPKFCSSINQSPAYREDSVMSLRVILGDKSLTLKMLKNQFYYFDSPVLTNNELTKN